MEHTEDQTDDQVPSPLQPVFGVLREHGIKRTVLQQKETHFSWMRTRLSTERTLMAWVRTSIALIGFGFTLFQFFEKFGPAVGTGEEGAPVAIWISALTLIAIGILATGLALYQYVGMVRYLWRPEFHDVAGARKRPVFTGAPVVAMFIGLSGIAALLVLLLSR